MPNSNGNLATLIASYSYGALMHKSPRDAIFSSISNAENMLCRLWKAFAIWRRAWRQAFMSRRRAHQLERTPHLTPAFQPTLLQVQLIAACSPRLTNAMLLLWFVYHALFLLCA